MATATTPHSDITAYEVARGTIDLPSGRQLSVFPKTASEDFTLANPFSYQQDFEIVTIGGFPCYDGDNKAFSFNIIFPAPPLDSILKSKTELIGAYTQPANSNSSALLSATKLVPMPVVAYDVYVRAPGFNLLIQSESLEDGGSFNDQIAVKALNSDLDLHNLILKHPELVSFVIRTYSLFEIVDATKAVGESVNKGVSDAFSKVFGASADPTLIVNRDAADRLKQELQSTVLIELHLPNTSADASFVKSAILDCIGKLKPVTVEDLKAATANIRLYGPDQAFVEMKPSEYQSLTSSWEKSDDVMKSLKSTWDTLAQLSTSSDSAKTFHRQVSKYVNDNGGTAGSINIFKFGGSGSFNLHLESKTDELSSSDLHDIEQVQKTLKDAGSSDNEFTKKAYQKWTGQNFASGTAAIKSLDLQLVSVADLSSTMKNVVSVIAAQSVQPRGGSRSIDFFAGDALPLTLFNSLGAIPLVLATSKQIKDTLPNIRIVDGPILEIDSNNEKTSVDIPYGLDAKFTRFSLIVGFSSGAFFVTSFPFQMFVFPFASEDAFHYPVLDFNSTFDMNKTVAMFSVGRGFPGGTQKVTLEYRNPGSPNNSLKYRLKLWYAIVLK